MEVLMSKRLKSSHKEFKKKSKKTLYNKFEYAKKSNQAERMTILEALSNNIGLPADILAGAPIVTATGRNELLIENYKGIIEYNGNVIKVQTKLCRIVIEGKNLNIIYFTNDEMRINGIIHSIKYV